MASDADNYCTFCGKSQDEVRHLISGPASAFICNECIERMMDIIRPMQPGFTVVPDEPTETMITAGLQVTMTRLTLPGSQLTQNREKMRLRYKAMLVAANQSLIAR